MEKFLSDFSNDFIEKINFFYLFTAFESKNKLIVTKDDCVYGIGNNSCGILGLGHSIEVKEPTIIPELCEKEIIEFYNGLSHCIARSSDGKLYSFGFNDFSQLGYKTEKLFNNIPKLIEGLNKENVIQVSCGARHTLALTQNGEVFGWGDNEFGQIGINGKVGFISSPMKISGFNNEKIQSISCGFCHSMALTLDGNVYSWGHNEKGQLGINTTIDTFLPQMITVKEKKQVSMASSFMLFIKNKLYKEVLFKKISCGYEHSLLLSTNGDIYSFGWNDDNQLGYETSGDHKQLVPQMIEMNPRMEFSDIYCHFEGRFSTSHSLTDGLCYNWGYYDFRSLSKIPEKTTFNSCRDLLFNNFGITITTFTKP